MRLDAVDATIVRSLAERRVAVTREARTEIGNVNDALASLLDSYVTKYDLDRDKEWSLELVDGGVEIVKIPDKIKEPEGDGGPE